MMPLAQRTEVVFAMVVAGSNVIHLVRGLGTSLAIDIPMRAAMAVSAEHTGSGAVPVGRKATGSRRTDPSGHLRTPRRTRWNGAPRRCVYGERLGASRYRPRAVCG